MQSDRKNHPRDEAAMSKQSEAQKVPTNMPSQARRPTNWSNMLTYISVLILVGTEIFGIALAGAWAIGGLFELGDSVTMALYVISGAGAVWAMYVFGKRAYGVDDRLEAQSKRLSRSN
jgi:hypothetical protein